MWDKYLVCVEHKSGTYGRSFLNEAAAYHFAFTTVNGNEDEIVTKICKYSWKMSRGDEPEILYELPDGAIEHFRLKMDGKWDDESKREKIESDCYYRS
jgi:hypothetical protein